jgi:hypothetical protein
MKLFVSLLVAAVLMPAVKLGLGTSNAAAQTAEHLVGAWAWVSVETTGVDGTKSHPFGPNPGGLVIFDGSGRFAWLISQSGRTKFAANNREMGTAEENKSTVHGSLAFTGSYVVKGDTLIFRIDASTYPNTEGAEQKRSITVTADELMWSNPATSRGAAGKAVLKRVK